jgi:hypothetical protein
MKQAVRVIDSQEYRSQANWASGSLWALRSSLRFLRSKSLIAKSAKKFRKERKAEARYRFSRIIRECDSINL